MGTFGEMRPMDESVLAPTRAQEMMQRLPLAVAVLEQDGHLVWSNERFGELFDPDAFAVGDLPQQCSTPRRVRLAGRASKPVEVLAYCLQATQFRMLVLDDAPGEGDAAAVRELHARLGELEREVMVDRLTGAWNRRYLDHAGAADLARSRRYRQPLAAALLDIDHFKRVNDSFGHQAGDAVLRELVQMARLNIRAADALVRWGGEEFLVLMPYTDYRAAARAAEKLRNAVAAHAFPAAGKVTISLGVAEVLADEDAEGFFQRLDAALYRAKEQGRNRVETDARGASDGWDGQDAGLMRLIWREEYMSGNPVIDSQHQTLFRLANEAIGASLRQPADAQGLAEALDRCLAHVAKHFADEEEILAAKGYLGLVRHQQAHRMLLERARSLQQAARNGDVSTGTLVEFLAREVVAQHLLAADRKFFPLFSQAQTNE